MFVIPLSIRGTTINTNTITNNMVTLWTRIFFNYRLVHLVHVHFPLNMILQWCIIFVTATDLYQSPFQREVVYWMSAPTNVLFSTVETEPCKGAAWYKLLMQRPRKPRGINGFFHVKMQGSELQSTFWESCGTSKVCSLCSPNKTYKNLLNTSSWKVKGKAVVTQQQRFCSKSSSLSLWQRPASLASSRSVLTSALVCLLTL